MTDEELVTSETAVALEEESKEDSFKSNVHDIEISLPVEPKSPEDLQEIVKKHGEWLRSVLDPKLKIVGGRANFSGAILDGWDFSCLYLAGASFSQANLRNIDFAGANLTGVDFSGALVSNCSFRATRLRRSHWDQASISSCDFSDADMLLTRHLEHKLNEQSEESDFVAELVNSTDELGNEESES